VYVLYHLSNPLSPAIGEDVRNTPEKWNFIAEKGFPSRFQKIISQKDRYGIGGISALWR
jgi:hypothetical protein